LTLLLSRPAGLPIQLAILVAYVLAVALHFLLQRAFVVRAQSTFVLSTREQLARYRLIGVVQYVVSASTTTLLPSILGVSEQIVYVEPSWRSRRRGSCCSRRTSSTTRTTAEHPDGRRWS
jgi:putative flippase GtrA